MQLTRFDRWLREKYAYEVHILTLRLPDRVPRRIKVIDLPEAAGKRYKHLLIARRSQDADALIAILRENSQMYETKIIDRKGLFVRIVAPKERSVTWRIFSFFVISTCAYFVLMYIKSLVENPEFRKNFSEAMEILKG